MYETNVHSGPDVDRPDRPRRATTLSVLLVVFGALGMLAALLLMALVNGGTAPGRSAPAVGYALGYAQFLLSAALATSGVFVWPGRSWARALAIGLCSVAVLGTLVTLVVTAQARAVLGVAAHLALLRLLNEPDVRAWCRR